MTTIQPVTPPSHTATAISEAEAAIRERLSALEAVVVTKEHSFVAWVKTNWLHLANGAGIVATVLKLFGKL